MKLRVGTFNLFQFCAPPYSWYIKKDKFNENEWKKKKEWIKNTLLEMNCDIVGFQEVFSQEELESLVKEVGFNHFITVDKPKIQNNKKVFISTTLALASKYPIKEIQKVKPHGQSILKYKFEGHFRFSRLPIKALIELPNKKEVTIYVNHFKSNRLNEFEYIFNKNTTLKEKKQKVLEALKNKYSPALKQRLCETSSLYYDFRKTKTPIICMCDLNDKEYSLSIDVLTNNAYHQDLDKDYNLLFDAFYLCDKKPYNPHPEKKIERTPTSYFQSIGNVIDYIFVSKEFNKRSKSYFAKISSYEVFDKHLKDNKNGSLLQSDHAQIVCEIEFFQK
ncbi:endonuclease/exonuclease/phosphatase family protein [Halarcobacter sp.]|uniref:endonuclease/exonuclease/phosphatase family protein n=1 Tax=Halarcobacter sp. TaxID=2321133 RepID=UPI002AA77E03|nr:endonuclease/exonuclease/phosphatase family protein [Halarcobacter sp.]